MLPSFFFYWRGPRAIRNVGSAHNKACSCVCFFSSVELTLGGAFTCDPLERYVYKPIRRSGRFDIEINLLKFRYHSMAIS
jgi:hypothetical protein